MSTGKTKKKVLFTSHVANFQKFNRPFMRWFRENGWEVHYASAGEEEVLDCDRHFTVPFERSPFKFNNFRAYKQLKNLIDKNNYDIIHTHTPMGSVVTRLAARHARKKGTRVIYTAHGFHFFKGAPLLNWVVYYPIEKFMARFTDTLIAINEEDYERAKQNFTTRVEYVPGVGLDESRFKPLLTNMQKTALRKSLGLKDSDYILIFPGELNKNKNQKLLIDVMAILTKEHSNIHLLLAGKGDKEDEYKQLSENLGVGNNVHFLGYRNDVPQLMQISNLAVSSSYREGLPVNLIEAMYAGLPVVATRVRGNADLVKDELSGYVVDINDTGTLCEKIGHFLEKRIDTSSFTANAKRAAQNYLLPSILAKMEVIYRNNKLSYPIRISVVIPAYNAIETIGIALDSILRQTASKYIHEAIVVDDGSSDNTREFVEHYQQSSHVKLVLIAQKNKGPSAARNAAIYAAKGNWIAFLDSDDKWDLRKIETQVACIEKFRNIKLITTNSQQVNSHQGSQVDTNLRKYGVISYFTQSRILTSSVMINREEIIKAGMFNESMQYAEDQNLFMKIIAEHDAYHVSEPLTILSDKPVYGASGLSSNLKEMHRGVLRNINELHTDGYLGSPHTTYLALLEHIKYLIRIVNTALRGKS